jgi:hypothetical protein
MEQWDVDWYNKLQVVLFKFPLRVLRLIVKYEHLATWGKAGDVLTRQPTHIQSILMENFMAGWDSGFGMADMEAYDNGYLEAMKKELPRTFIAGQKRGRDEGFCHGYDRGYQIAMKRELPIAYHTGKKHGAKDLIQIFF